MVRAGVVIASEELGQCVCLIPTHQKERSFFSHHGGNVSLHWGMR